jgi:cytoskeletal protein RodZ
MGYNSAEVDQREEAKEKEGWKVAIVSVVAFIIVGLLIWTTGFGGKY